jgi:hypothetical protein
MDPTYPESDRVASSAEAVRVSSFRVFVPNTSLANDENLTDAFVLGPGGGVVFDYPLTREPLSSVRMNYIEVYEAPWTEKTDPLTWYKKQVAAAPSPGMMLTNIQGLPAVEITPNVTVVTAGTPSVDANPAFLRFVLDDTEIQIAGGDDLDALVQIAESLIAGSKS